MIPFCIWSFARPGKALPDAFWGQGLWWIEDMDGPNWEDGRCVLHNLTEAQAYYCLEN